MIPLAEPGFYRTNTMPGTATRRPSRAWARSAQAIMRCAASAGFSFEGEMGIRGMGG